MMDFLIEKSNIYCFCELESLVCVPLLWKKEVTGFFLNFDGKFVKKFDLDTIA